MPAGLLVVLLCHFLGVSAWADLRFELVRHLGSFDECATMLSPARLAPVPTRDRVHYPTGAAPVEEFQDYYFDAMGGALTSDELRYYRSLTRTLGQGQVSFIGARDGDTLDSVLMVASAQGSTAEQGPSARFPLPFERQYPELVHGEDRRFRWEVGRARGGRHFREAVALSLVLMYAELRFMVAWRPESWTQMGFLGVRTTLAEHMDKWAEHSRVSVHAPTATHRDLYRSRRFGLHLDHAVRGEDGSENYILSDDLKSLLGRFNAFDVAADVFGLREATGLSDAREAVDLAITFRQFHIPLIFGTLEFSNFTSEKRARVEQGLRESYPGLTYEGLRAGMDVRSEIEKRVFPDGPAPLSAYREVFGSDSLMFVDGLESLDLPADTPWKEVARHMGSFTRAHTDASGEMLAQTKVVTRMAASRAALLAVDLEATGFEVVRRLGSEVIVAAPLPGLVVGEQEERLMYVGLLTQPSSPLLHTRWFGQFMGF